MSGRSCGYCGAAAAATYGNAAPNDDADVAAVDAVSAYADRAA